MLTGRTGITPRGKQELPSVARKSAGAGFGGRQRGCFTAAAAVALLLLPIEASDAGWLSDIFKGKKDKPPKHSVAPRQAAEPRRAAPAKPAAAPKPRAEKPAV